MEGNLIIIAACIPILQPIVEILKGRKRWSTGHKSDDRQYKDFSKQSDRQGDPLELQPTKNKKKVDQYGMTIHDKETSEEQIVIQKTPSEASDGRQSETFDKENGIVRTNAVSVTYDGRDRWAVI